MKTVLNLILWSACTAGGTVDSVSVERQAFLMGTTLTVEVCAVGREAGIAAIDAAFDEVRRIERLLSSWDPDSEVGRLNATPKGEMLEASDSTRALLEEARRWVDATGGAFDPAIGGLIDLWDLRGAGRVPGTDEIEAVLGRVGMRHWSFEPLEAKWAPAEAWIDTGAFGKGAALRAVRARLAVEGIEKAQIDFGGQQVLVGPGGAWIDIADPMDRGRAAARTWVENASVATTGQSERWVEIDGMRYGHVLDPRTGLPVEAWGSVTVVAEDPMIADILSTALYVLGPGQIPAWVGEMEGVEVVVQRAGAGTGRESMN